MELTAATWESTVIQSEHVWAIWFHSGMCGTCQEFKPEWEKLAAQIEGLCGACALTCRMMPPAADSFSHGVSGTGAS